MTQGEVDKALNDPWVAKLRNVMHELYTSEQFGVWLALPHPQFEGVSALEMILAGRGEEVLHEANRLADGAYI